jgi:L-lysine exporter family protein LysE/ArgO
MEATAYLRGVTLGASLIVPIGVQNAFVLQQGLRREHAGAIALTCALSDAILIVAGLLGLGDLISRAPELLRVVNYLGAGYLVWFSIQALRRAMHPQAMGDVHAMPAQALGKALLTTLTLTFLNPHVYLDTVVLLGTVGAREPGAGRMFFGAGAVSASFVWFFAIAFGAKALAPLLRKPIAWRCLDGAIGVGILFVAWNLVR